MALTLVDVLLFSELEAAKKAHEEQKWSSCYENDTAFMYIKCSHVLKDCFSIDKWELLVLFCLLIRRRGTK